VYSLGVVLSELLPDPPAAVREVIERSTAADARERHADAAAFLTSLRHGWAPEAVPAPSAPVLRNPYKGLRAFTEADAPDFFGREAFTSRLLTRLREQGPAWRFLAVVGASGSGKSSVVRAGLIPALRVGALPGSQSWFVAEMAPGTAPMEELEAALLRIAVKPPPALLDRLEADDTGLLRVADLILPDGAEDLLLVIDQFEEVFTLATADRARHFLDSLVTALTDPASRLRVVVTLRADFYDRPLRHRGLAELIRWRTETVVPLTGGELERAVTRPAERVGVGIEPGLVAQMVADVGDEPGALPLLQYALTELFDRRQDSTLVTSAYRQIGGVSGALARRAEEVYAALPDGAREAARQLFLRLVTLGEGVEDVRRRVLRAELMSLQLDPEDMERAIDAFGGARLLSFDRDPETRQPTVEVAHEALLREWGRLRAWIDTVRDDLRIERRLASAGRDWLDASRDVSYLASGSRLDQYEAWRQQSGLSSTPLEREFLDASLAERDRRQAEDEVREARERALERRSFRRLRALVAVLAAAALVAIGLTVFAYTQQQRAEREARVAGARELSAAAVANLDVDPERSILLALEAVDRTRAVDGSVLPEAEEALHRAVTTSRVELTVPGVGGKLDWSPDGTMFVTEGPEDSGRIDIRDAETGESIRSWHGHDVDMNDVAFSADGSMLATTGDDGALRVWNPETGEELWTLEVPDDEAEVWGPSFSPDGSLVAAAWLTVDRVRVWDLATGRVAQEISSVRAPFGAFFSPDGRQLAVPSERTVVVVDASTGEERFTLEGHEWDVVHAGWSPDGRWIATTSVDLTARIWDADTGDQRFTLHGHSGAIIGADWSPDSTRLVTGSEDGTAKLWEITETGTEELLTLSALGTAGGINVAFSPDGEHVMTGDIAITAAKIWDVTLTGDAEWVNLPAMDHALTAVAFAPDGRLLIGNEDGSITVWDPETGRDLLRTDGHGIPDDPGNSQFYAIDVSPDGALIATAWRGRPPATVRDAVTGNEVFTAESDEWVDDVTWNPDGTLLAMAGQRGVTILDRSGKQIALLRDPGFNVFAVRFSPDGRVVATARSPKGRPDRTAPEVKIWDWQQARVVRTIQTQAEDVAFDPSGTRLATSDPDGPVEIWDVASGEKIATLAGHTSAVWSLRFSPDGSEIASASFDSTVRVWEAKPGGEVVTLRGHKGGASHVALSPDGSKLASVGTDNVRVWALDLDDLVEIANNELTRTLTDDECRQYLHTDQCPP
jgi:WD40 repeat protein